MITEIGIVAGEIWNLLDKSDSAPIDTIVDSLNRNRELVLMSLGWLAREGHVEMTPTKNGLVAALKKR